MGFVKFLTGGLLAVAIALPLAGCGGHSHNDSAFLPEALTYVATPDNTDMEVWMMTPDGSGKLMLADNPDGDALQGSLSPNGRKLLYLAEGPGTKMTEKDLNTGALTVLLEDAGDSNNDMTPAYNPSGSKVAHSDSRTRDIYVINADGTGSVDLTTGADTDISPAWNRAGTKIAFDRGWTGDIWMMNADGSGLTRVNPESETYTYGQPQFLPDGRIVCMRDGAEGKDIVLMNADGTGETVLTPDTDGVDDFCPTVNHAGTKIAFATKRNGQKDIYVGTLSGSTLTDLTNLTEDVDYDCWRPCFGVIDSGYLNTIQD